MLLKETDAVIAIRTGFFLRDRKLAKVTPMYKKCIPGYYRPVFVLPA